jgi:bacteriorhodopsin
VAFLVILYLVWVPLRAKADSQGAEIGAIFHRVAGLLSVLWAAYPLTWFLGPSGIDLLSQEVDTTLFTVVPILSKVGWSIVDLSSLRALAGRESPHSAEPLTGRKRMS